MRFNFPDKSDFIGAWDYQREFDNGCRGTGAALFKNNVGNRLFYSENGKLILPNGQILNSSVQYEFLLNSRGIDIFFTTPKEALFQSINFELKDGTYTGQASHQCSKDVYSSQYTFFHDKSFETIHNVKGPKKNYISKTLFRKI